MGQNTNRLHMLIGEHLREIEKVKKSAKDKRLSEKQLAQVKSLRKMIVETANKLQKGIGW